MNSSDRIQPSPRPVEPSGDIFIDRGLAVPDVYPGDRLRVHVRDPHTVFVYWEVAQAGPHGWRVILRSADGAPLASFDTPAGHHRSGYVHVDDVGRVAEVVLLERLEGGGLRTVSRVSASLRVRRPLVATGSATPEHWVDLRTGDLGPDSPGTGRVETLGFAHAAEVQSSAAIVAGGRPAHAGDGQDTTAPDDAAPWHRRKRGVPEPRPDHD